MAGIFAGTWFGLAALAVCSLAFFLLLSWEAFVDRHPFRADGTPRVFGWPKRSASTTTKARGTRTPETATTAGCSFSSVPGDPWADGFALTSHRLGNSFTAPSSSIGATADRGGNGERQDDAA